MAIFSSVDPSVWAPCRFTRFYFFPQDKRWGGFRRTVPILMFFLTPFTIFIWGLWGSNFSVMNSAMKNLEAMAPTGTEEEQTYLQLDGGQDMIDSFRFLFYWRGGSLAAETVHLIMAHYMLWIHRLHPIVELCWGIVLGLPMCMFPIYCVSISKFGSMNFPGYTSMLYAQFALAGVYLVYAAAAFAAVHKWRLKRRQDRRKKEIRAREQARQDLQQMTMKDMLLYATPPVEPKMFV